MKKIRLILSIILLFNIGIIKAETIVLTDSLFKGYSPELEVKKGFQLKDISTLDDENIILTGQYKGNGGIIIRTTDGGSTWEKIFEDDFNKNFGNDPSRLANYTLWKSAYINKDDIFTFDVIGDMIFKYNSHKKNWDSINSFDFLITPETVEMTDTKNGFIFSYGLMVKPKLIKTESGWIEWSVVDYTFEHLDTLNYRYFLNSGKIINNKAYFLLNEKPKEQNEYKIKKMLIKDLSTNKESVYNLPNYTRDVYFYNDNEGIAVGHFKDNKEVKNDSAVVYKTYDGGESWEIMFQGQDLSFYVANRIYNYGDKLTVVLGTYNNILISRDKGETWKNIADKSLEEYNIQYLSIASEKVIYYHMGNKLMKWVDGETSVVELPKMNEFNIYPNPVQNQLRIENYEIGINHNIEIYNVLSEKVLTANISENNSINVSNLTPGVYFIKIGDKVEKFVKE